MLVFKGKPFANLESKLKNHQLVQSGKVIVACQMNTWIDSKTFNIQLDKIWIRSYDFYKIDNRILHMDSATSHLTEDIVNKLDNYNSKYKLIPPELASYYQPLYLFINKPFKDLIKKRYREFLIDTNNNKKPIPEDLITWVYET